MNAGLSSLYAAPSERDKREVSEMYKYAVDADEDDDDMISPVCLHSAFCTAKGLSFSTLVSMFHCSNALATGISFFDGVQEAFIDVCYMNNLGIGVHPQKRLEMVKAKASAKGHS